MNRSQKELLVQELKQDFQNNNSAFLIKIKGLTVNQAQTLRKGLRGCDSKMKVAKDRLVKIAIHDNASAQELNPFLKDQLAVVFVKKDSAAAAKVINDFTKLSKLEIIVGLVESQIFDKDKIVRLASIPSREVLLAQLCGLLKAPVSSLARSLSEVAAQKSAPTTGSENVAEEVAESVTEVASESSTISE